MSFTDLVGKMFESEDGESFVVNKLGSLFANKVKKENASLDTSYGTVNGAVVVDFDNNLGMVGYDKAGMARVLCYKGGAWHGCPLSLKDKSGTSIALSIGSDGFEKKELAMAESIDEAVLADKLPDKCWSEGRFFDSMHRTELMRFLATKNKILWISGTSWNIQHQDIGDYYNINVPASDDRRSPVRGFLGSRGGLKDGISSNWHAFIAYTEDIFPSWFDFNDVQNRARKELSQWRRETLQKQRSDESKNKSIDEKEVEEEDNRSVIIKDTKNNQEARPDLVGKLGKVIKKRHTSSGLTVDVLVGKDVYTMNWTDVKGRE